MPFDSLFIGVSGLESYQQQIDVISNNIANVGTTGFKGQNVTFQDLLYQTQQFPSAPSQNRGGVNAQDVGLGVKVGTVDSNFSQGGLQTTGINTDLAINGDGFFVLNNVQGNGNPTYTRDGHFSINQNGLIYDPSSGLGVMGYNANAAGQINGTGNPGPIQIPLGLKSQATATGSGSKSGPTKDQVFDVSFGGNLDQTQYIQALSNNAAGPANTISTTMYDSEGNAHLVNIVFNATPSGAAGGVNLATTPIPNTAGNTVFAATEWKYTITPTDGSTFGANTGFVFFDQNGQFINTSNGAGTVPNRLAGANPNTANGNQLTVTNWQNGNLASTPNTTPGPIGLDFSNMTSLSGAVTANTVSQNGYAAGILSNINIGQDGTVTGSFTNGQSQTLARIAMATFQNEQGLHRIGSNQFQTSANSGLAQYGTPASGRFGTVVSGSLEQSNVSIADEFTKMILAQRSFEANSRSITTADQDLQTIIALKR